MVTDANDATTPGILYGANATTINVPYSAWWCIEPIVYSNLYITQIAYITNALTPVIYARTCNQSGWGLWRPVYRENYSGSVTMGITGTTSNPTVTRLGNVCIMTMGVKIPAGSYESTKVLWTVSPKPSQLYRFIVDVAATAKPMVMTASGEVKFNNNITLAADGYIIGQLTYFTLEGINYNG